MNINITKREIFELLQSENFVIGNDLFSKSKLLIEEKSNRLLNNLSTEKLAYISSHFKSIRSKWKILKGGRQRSIFIEKNLEENIVFKFDLSELKQETNELNSTIPCVSFDQTSYSDLNEPNGKKACLNKMIGKSGKKWINSKIKSRRQMRAVIQDNLTKYNNFLEKFGLCFKKIEIVDSSQHTYNNTFKIGKTIKCNNHAS